MKENKKKSVQCDGCGKEVDKYILLGEHRICSVCETDFDENMLKLHDNYEDLVDKVGGPRGNEDNE